jgi:hypothetical protein
MRRTSTTGSSECTAQECETFGRPESDGRVERTEAHLEVGILQTAFEQLRRLLPRHLRQRFDGRAPDARLVLFEEGFEERRRIASGAPGPRHAREATAR